MVSHIHCFKVQPHKNNIIVTKLTILKIKVAR